MVRVYIDILYTHPYISNNRNPAKYKERKVINNFLVNSLLNSYNSYTE